MNCQSSYGIWTSIIPAVFGLIGAALGGYLTYLSMEKTRKRKLLSEIADDFSSYIGQWSRKSFQIDDAFRDWHRGCVDHLSPHINYLQRRHNALFQTIRADWLTFSGGDKAIEKQDLINHPDKNYWMAPLYNIYDALMNY